MQKSGKKKIVLINQHTSYLFIDITNEFSSRFDEIVLFSGFVRPMGIDLSEKVKVVKIAKYNKRNTFTRAFSWLWGFFQTVFLLKFRYRGYEVFAVTNPPLLNLLPLLIKTKMSLLVYDIYPDGLVAVGFIKPNNLINRFWSKWNKKSFEKLHSIITLTPGMADLLSKYVRRERIQVVPVWMNREVGRIKQDTENAFLRKYNLNGKFLIIYSGNLGKGYNLEQLVFLAESIKDNKKIQILIIGEGYKKEKLDLMIRERNLENCLLLPFQPSELFLQMLDAMHIGVVALDPSASKIAIPSKTFNIIGAGKPIISFSPADSDLANLIISDGFGGNFLEGDLAKLKAFVVKVAADQGHYESLAKNAFLSSKKFTHKNAETIYNLHTSE